MPSKRGQQRASLTTFTPSLLFLYKRKVNYFLKGDKYEPITTLFCLIHCSSAFHW